MRASGDQQALTELTPEQAYEGLLFAFANGWRPEVGPAADTFDEHEAPTARILTGFLAAPVST